MANILIIDDDYDLGRALSQVVKKMGHNVTHCPTLTRGLAAVSENNLDVIFLDEVGELSLSNQKSFLRALQERRFRPVGGDKEISSDFMLIAATNRDLEKMVRERNFRQDLLFRIRSLMINIIPLRERKSDIKILANHFINQFSELNGKGTKGFSPEFIQILNAYDWPGNVREMANAMENAFSSAGDDPLLYPQHLPTYLRVKMARTSMDRGQEKPPPIPARTGVGLKQQLPGYREFRDTVLEESEKRYFKELMELAQGSVQEACQISGLGRTRLYSLLKKHNISRFGWPARKLSAGQAVHSADISVHF